MFAVPGWNVSAKSLAREHATNAKPAPSADSGFGASSPHKRKRPRNGAESSRKIGGLELEKLWNKRFATQPQRQERTQPDPTLKHASKESRHELERKPTQSTPKPPKQIRDRENPKKAHLKQKDKQKKQRKHQNGEDTTSKATTSNSTSSSSLPPQPPSPATTNLTPLQIKMRDKLTSARFRHLNQTLYTSPSTTSLALFTNTPSLFTEYHAGFTMQVQSSWPTNPIATFTTSLLSRGHLPNPRPPTPNPLPRRKTSSCTIADLGCGDAPLARALHHQLKNLLMKIHSYDLFSPNKHVTVADIAKLPLRDGEADIAIFCLSLMGTNWIDFVEEAWRILRGDGKGELWIAEVKSRFGRRKNVDGVVDHSVGKQRKMPKAKKPRRDDVDEDEMVGAELFASSASNQETEEDSTDTSAFVTVLQRRGFTLQDSSVDKSNKMFVSMIFHKSGVPTTGKYKGWKWNGKEYAKQHDGKMRFGGDDEDEIDRVEEGKVLKPCVYKSR